MERQIVLDTETTGIDPKQGHRIIEIGAVKMSQGKVTDEFSMVVAPSRPVPDYVRRLTGIENSELKQGVALKEALLQFEKFIGDCTLVAHNATFDMNFLGYEFDRVLGRPLKNEGLCSLKLSKYLVRDSNAHKLEVMADYFEVELETRHRALTDARMTAHILVPLLDRLRKAEEVTDLIGARKFFVETNLDYFPSCLVTPEELNEFQKDPGVVYFKGENGKRLHAWAVYDVQHELITIDGGEHGFGGAGFAEGRVRAGFARQLVAGHERVVVDLFLDAA